ncbi:MAG: hypothetical protein AAB048_06480, partial [Planctomycetota bacterium]
AIEQALSQAVKGDVVLIAGKGHEQTQDLGKLVIPFDDVEVVRQVLSKGTARGKAAEAVPLAMEELQHAGSL